MNSKEIIKELLNQDIGISEFACGEMENPLPVIGAWKNVEEHGGCEGSGEEYWSVNFFEDHDVYLRADGRYYSYDGLNFYDGIEGLSEVHPQVRPVTFYEPIKA